MEHAEFRRLFGANPKRAEPELLAHREGCAECARYAADLERVDQLVSGALAVPAPASYRKPWEIEQERRSPLRWYALAASVLVAMVVAGGAWLHQRRDALFVEIAVHANNEIDRMVTTDKRTPEEKVRRMVSKAGARLSRMMPVSTARVCKVQGVVSPHLFVQTPEGPVQLMLLTEHRFYFTHSAEKQGLITELVPVGQHSVAVIGASSAAVEQGVRMVHQSFDWSP